MSGRRPEAWEERAAKATSEVARRAIRRLDVLEWVMLTAAVGLAAGGGALVAFLVGDIGSGFRTRWVISTVGLLLLSGGIAFAKLRT